MKCNYWYNCWLSFVSASAFLASAVKLCNSRSLRNRRMCTISHWLSMRPKLHRFYKLVSSVWAASDRRAWIGCTSCRRTVTATPGQSSFWSHLFLNVGSSAIRATWIPLLVNNLATSVFAQNTLFSHRHSSKRQAGQLYCWLLSTRRAKKRNLHKQRMGKILFRKQRGCRPAQGKQHERGWSSPEPDHSCFIFSKAAHIVIPRWVSFCIDHKSILTTNSISVWVYKIIALINSIAR